MGMVGHSGKEWGVVGRIEKKGGERVGDSGGKKGGE